MRVVPTRGIAEGFAALLAYDPEAAGRRERRGDGRRGDQRAWPARSPGPCATRPATSGPIAEGDYLGIAGDGIRAVEPTLAEAATDAARPRWSTDDHEIVTVIEGEGATPADTRRHHRVARRATGPDVTVEVHHGGQPLYPYLFGIE